MLVRLGRRKVQCKESVGVWEECEGNRGDAREGDGGMLHQILQPKTVTLQHMTFQHTYLLPCESELEHFYEQAERRRR